MNAHTVPPHFATFKSPFDAEQLLSDLIDGRVLVEIARELAADFNVNVTADESMRRLDKVTTVLRSACDRLQNAEDALAVNVVALSAAMNGRAA